MIKKMLVLLMIIFIFSFSACQQNNDSKSNNENTSGYQRTEKRIGEIKSLGSISNSSKANFILKQQDGSTLLLNLDVTKFDYTKYIGKQIEVNGTINSATDGTKVMIVKSVDIIDVEVKITDEAAVLTAYNGKMTAVNFKYLSSFELKDGVSDILLTLPIKSDESTTGIVQSIDPSTEVLPPVTIAITKISSSFEQTLAEFLNLNSDSSSDLIGAGFSKSIIGENSVDALKKEEQAGNVVIYYVKRGAFVFKIAMIINDRNVFSEAQKDFYNLLSTLKFNIEDAPEITPDQYEVNYADNPIHIDESVTVPSNGDNASNPERAVTGDDFTPSDSEKPVIPGSTI